tara:strand:+ start:10019 stop:11365 length:1347 start_codon:yes stop_codon:yes gene_type:complete
MSNRFLEIACSNKTSDGKMSYRHGISDLIFQIPAMNSTLIPSSVRIVGKLKVFKNQSGAGVGAVVTAGDDINMDARLGAWGCFQSLTTKSIRHQQNIEHIRHYGHFLKSYLPLSTSLDDNLGHLDETALTLPNYELNKISNVVRKTGAEGFSGNSFCVGLPCGLFSGTRHIPLNEDMLSGLEVKIALSPESQVLYAVGGTIADNDCYYEFSDLKLVCEVVDYTDAELKQMKSQSGSSFTYQSVSSYYDTINSSNASVVFNLGLSKVRSAFATFIPSTFLNSLSHNGYATLMPTNNITTDSGFLASVKKLVWTKGGSLYPKMYELNNNIRNAPLTNVCDPVISRDYVSSVVPFVKNNSTMISPMNNMRSWTADTSSTKQLPYTKIGTGVVWGLGVNYDSLGGQGEDFRTQQFGMNIELDLISDNPISTFVFVNSEQNIFFNDNGLRVEM